MTKLAAVALPPCQSQALGEISGRLVEASAQLERVLEILEKSGLKRETAALRTAVATVDSVMVDIVMQTGCDERQLLA